MNMKPDLREQIIRILNENRIMTIATNRPDGWPHATVVGYANDGFKLYFFVARTSQKFRNIQRDPRVSIAVARDFSQPLEIRGLSLAGTAAPVEQEDESERAAALMLERYPEYAAWPRPNPALAPLMRVVPEIISVLDYSKGFGHSDLVSVTRDDIERHIETSRHGWRQRAAQG
jgi:PPOX class probable F420-dependent enzyme